MAILSKSAFLAKYNSIFSTNGANEISASNLREFVQDTIDSFPSFIDNSEVMGLSEYNPTRNYEPNQVTYYDGNLQLCIANTTGTFDSTKFVQLPILKVIQDVAAWQSITSHSTGDIVRHGWRLFIATDSSVGEEPYVGSSYWSLISNINDGMYGNPYQLNTFYGEAHVVKYLGLHWLRPSAGYSTDFATERTNGEWVLRESFVKWERRDISYSFFSQTSTVTGEYIMNALLPAGAVPVAVKFKHSVAYSGTGIGDVSFDVFIGSAYTSLGSLKTGFVSDAPGDTVGSFATDFSKPFIPNHSSPQDVGVQVTVDTDFTALDSGIAELWIAYIVMI